MEKDSKVTGLCPTNLESQEKLKKKCPYCPFASHYAASLTVHIRRHTGEKPYQCQYCTKVLRFSDRSNMNSHVRKYHKKPISRKNSSSFIALSPRESINPAKRKQTSTENSLHFDYFPLPIINSVYGAITSPAGFNTSIETVDANDSPCTSTNHAVPTIPQSNKPDQSDISWETPPRPRRRKPAIVRRQNPLGLDENIGDNKRITSTNDLQSQSEDENLHGGNEPESNSLEIQCENSSSEDVISNRFQSHKVEGFDIPELTQPAIEDLQECHHCGIYFKSLVLHTLHMGSHGYDDPFKCNACGVQCQNEVEFHCHFLRGNHRGVI